MKKVLMINLGWEQQPAANLIATQGHSIYVVHNTNPKTDIPLAGMHLCDLRDLESILSYAMQVQPDAVISDQCDYSMFAQAVVAENLGLPGPSIQQAQIATNKLIQRTVARDAGLMVPEFETATSEEEARVASDRIGYPVVFKPLDNRGSFGVSKVSSPAEVRASYMNALVNSHSRIVLVEKFIHGVHITVDGYAFPKVGCKSLTCATKQLLGTERQVAMDIIYPGEMAPALRAKAMRVNEEVNKKLGFTFGMTHSEYMVTPEEDIYLIESANRGGGCFTSELIVPANSDVDVLAQLVSDALGGYEDRYATPSENGVLLKFFRFQPGRIAAIRGVDQLLAMPGVLALHFNIEAGDMIEPITTDGNRHGFLILKHNGPDIRAEADQIMKLISIDYEYYV
jgi:biotin carboxylase